LDQHHKPVSPLIRLWSTVREHISNAAVGGAIVALTGFAPEHWFAEALQAIHIPVRLLNAWPSSVDGRMAIVSIGIAIIVIDVLWQRRASDRHRQLAFVSGGVPEADEQPAGNISGQARADHSLILPGKRAPSDDDRPAFAVLPFNNMSGDPEQEYFADGISEDLIAAISSWCQFPVIARNSSFVYKGRSVDLKQVGQELGARYLLEGSVQKFGNRVRITAKLIDATTGHHLWANHYDRDIGDIFAIQDEITTSIAAAIEPELHEMEERRAAQTRTTSLAAYDLTQRANWHHNKFTPADAKEAQRLFAAAIEADANYAPAYFGMAYTKFLAAQMNWTEDREETLRSALEFARKAVVLDDKDPRAHMYLGQVSLWLRRYDDAISETRRAIELNPSLANAYSVLGYALDCVGKFEEARTAFTRSLRLRPNDRTLARCLPGLSVAHYQLGDYDAAEEIARRAVTINPIYWMGHQMLAASLGQLGRKEAVESVAEIQRRFPNISRKSFSEWLPFRDPIYGDRIEDGLVKAGWAAER
jgi:adenylate cyclase